MEHLFFHPKLVHVPMGLAVVIPLVAFVVWTTWARGVFPKPAFAIVVLLQALLVGGAVASLRSGEAEAERVEKIVGDEAIEHHEDAAKAFTFSGAGVLVLMAAALMWKDKRSQTLALVSCVATLAVLALGIRAGHEGGELVYERGAASAYTNPEK